MSQQQRGKPTGKAQAIKYPRPPVIERGPVDDAVQPPKRRDPSLVFHEDVIAMFDVPPGTGWDKCKAGVNLEICDVLGDMFDSEHGRSSRIFLLFIDPRKGKPMTYFDEKAKEHRKKWYVCNQTAKKALRAAFGTRHIINWVGWVSLGVREVENRLEGAGVMVSAIRFGNKLPDLQPTFDYAAEIQARLAKHGGAAPAQRERPPVDDDRPVGGPLTDEERAAIAAAEREQFTADPDEDTGS